MRSDEWIGVDFDGTLVTRVEWTDKFEDKRIGEPIWPMINRVKRWIREGKQVRIVTARVARGFDPTAKHWMDVRNWTFAMLGQHLPVTSEKDPYMVELWDDRAIQLEPDTGRRVDMRTDNG